MVASIKIMEWIEEYKRREGREPKEVVLSPADHHALIQEIVDTEPLDVLYGQKIGVFKHADPEIAGIPIRISHPKKENS